MNLAKLEKHYRLFTVDERARLMIAARMREDDVELKKLIASAERKHYTIRANDESDICEAWHKAHLILICCNAEHRIDELRCAMTCWQLVSDENTEREYDEDLAERVFNIELAHRHSRKLCLLAFLDWIEVHQLPLEKGLLEACGIDLTLLDNEDKDELKKYDSYSEIYSLFTNAWDNR